MKKLKKMLRAKRAFSPVIAALILMLLAVAAGVVVYAYVMGWIGGATTTGGGTKGELQFDSLHANTTHITIYVRNVGGKDLTLDKIYVEGENKTVTGTMGSLSVNTASGKLVVAHSMTAGYHYEVKVTCTDGTSVSQSVEAE